MKTWMIIAVITGLLLIAGIAAVSAVSVNTSNNIEKPVNSATCTSCGGKCTAGSNCGLATCGATQGKACSCGK